MINDLTLCLRRNKISCLKPEIDTCARQADSHEAGYMLKVGVDTAAVAETSQLLKQQFPEVLIVARAR